eukprot:TRINITY_DN8904_c0_g1_i2.p1 TRINITY_DN8904_c0_g1~~TRINITY_DN8904_c0_g1_i2.p1  ORF type:complete len:937 (+),score=242.03 TRINITY_DN8904_c0_g1_i2:364-3174(+)
MSMLHFEGRLSMEGVLVPLEFNNLALRGCRLRNTKWITGLAVYTGHESKILLNSTPTRFKQSSLEKTANTMIVVVFFIEILLCVFASLAAGIWHSSYVGTGSNTAWYLQNRQSHSGFAAEAFLTFFILVSNLIPISLYVTMEVMKICLSLLIEQDIEMYSSSLDIAAQARTTNLSEELGQVGYVFSDKTGTLTSNVMEFRKCTIAGRVYTDDEMGNAGLSELEDVAAKRPFQCQQLLQTVTEDRECQEAQFIRILAVCHTVMVETDADGKAVYQASSPDDLALVEAAAEMGVAFSRRTNDGVTVTAHGEEQFYKVLNLLDFSSDRKRMSVVVQHPDGTLSLLCKGADTVVFPLLRGGQALFVDELCGQLQEFASDGFRTLCVAHKKLDPQEYASWDERYQEARGSLEDRTAKVSTCMRELEDQLDLIGVTAIEDKLQLGVPAAIQALSQAGIKTWMLTGDKSETAVNIGFSCKLLNENMLPLIELTTANPMELETELDKALREMKAHDANLDSKLGQQWGVVLEGCALATLFQSQNEEVLDKMVQVALRADAVLGCRLSPMQKAEMVETIQANINTVTLAIGDGANDVSMITSAHVGVGIAGLEGLSAVNSSDYSIAQFRFLVPLILWHGHNSYRRISKLILYFFYKNIVFNMPLYFFAITAGWSGQSMYESWSIMGYNTIFTALPVMCMSLMDQDLPKAALLLRPPLYRSGLEGVYFNVHVLICWVLSGLWHSVLIYWFVINVYSGITSWSGKDLDIYDIGVATYTLVVLVVTFKLMLEMHYYSWINVLCIIVSFAIWFVWCFGSHLWYVGIPDTYMTIYHLMSTAAFYLICAACTVTCLTRDAAWKYAKRVYFPAPYHLMQEAIAVGLPLEDVDINTGKRRGVLKKIFMLQVARCASSLRSCLFKGDQSMYNRSNNAHHHRADIRDESVRSKIG